MRSLSYAVSLFTLLLLPLAPQECFADSTEGRPWGRVDKPAIVPPESGHKSGYLGRYNPWSKSGNNKTDEPPRYRKRGNEDPSSRAPTQSGERVYPPRQPYAPMPLSQPHDQEGRYPYASPFQPYSVPPGLAPWDGGLNPDYGNYWNDPYDTLQPERGLLWSDMWR